MANTKIVLDRQSDLILTNAVITNPQGIVLTDISGVSEAVASINTSTSTDISVETSSRVAADASLQNQIDFITNNADPAAIDSLVEVVVAFQSADGDLNGAITNLANAATTDLSAEISRAQSAEESLSNAKLNLAGGTMSGSIDMGGNVIDNVNRIVISPAPTDGDSATNKYYVDNQDALRVSKAGDTMSGLLNMANNVIANLGTPLDGGDATNKTYVDTKLPLAGGTMSGDINLGTWSVTNATTIAGRFLRTDSIEGETGSAIAFNGSELDFQSNSKVTNLPAPTNGGDATNKTYVDTKLPLAGGTMSGTINMGYNQLLNVANIHVDAIVSQSGGPIDLASEINADGNIIKGLPAPTNGDDAANKTYVDSVLSSEVSRAESADASLQNQIDFITNNADPAAIDSLTEVVAAFQSADGDINNAITNLANAATTDLSAEVSRAQSAEASLDVAKLNLAGGTMSGDINMGNNSISNANDIAANSVTTISVATNQLTTNLLGGENGSEVFVASNINFQESGLPINLPAPTNGGDAANKTYVDGVSSTISTELSASVSDRVVADESLAATISTEIESLALTDESTIELNTADNTIRLKETVSAPDSGVRTFLGEVDVETVLKVAGVDVMATLSSEVSRAESAEASIAEELSSEVSYIMANTDLSSIDSFAEVVEKLDTVGVSNLNTDLNRNFDINVFTELKGNGNASHTITFNYSTLFDGVTVYDKLQSLASKRQEVATLSNTFYSNNIGNFSEQTMSEDDAANFFSFTAHYMQLQKIINLIDTYYQIENNGTTLEEFGTLSHYNKFLNFIGALQSEIKLRSEEYQSISYLGRGFDNSPKSDGNFLMSVDEVIPTFFNHMFSFKIEGNEGSETIFESSYGNVYKLMKSGQLNNNVPVNTYYNLYNNTRTQLTNLFDSKFDGDNIVKATYSDVNNLLSLYDTTTFWLKCYYKADYITSFLQDAINNTPFNLLGYTKFVAVVEKINNVDYSALAKNNLSFATPDKILGRLAGLNNQKVGVTETPDGSVTTFTLVNAVKADSESIYLNGLLLDEGDYTSNYDEFNRTISITFTTAPSTGDKVKAYGVY